MFTDGYSILHEIVRLIQKEEGALLYSRGKGRAVSMYSGHDEAFLLRLRVDTVWDRDVLSIAMCHKKFLRYTPTRDGLELQHVFPHIRQVLMNDRRVAMYPTSVMKGWHVSGMCMSEVSPLWTMKELRDGVE